MANSSVKIATTNPMTVEIKASPKPPVTPAALVLAALPKSIAEKDRIKPKIVPNKPNKGEAVIIV